MLVCVVSSSSKEVPSSLGMQRTVNTSGLLEARVNIVLRELYRSRINSYLNFNRPKMFNIKLANS